MTQNNQILRHLENGHRITPRIAMIKFGCMRLAARVHDLRNEGHKIKDERVCVETRNGTARIKEYYL